MSENSQKTDITLFSVIFVGKQHNEWKICDHWADTLSSIAEGYDTKAIAMLTKLICSSPCLSR